MDADGANLHEIASDPGLCLNDASFTPDGERVVYIQFDFAIEVETIWSMKLDGSDRQLITGAGGPDPNVRRRPETQLQGPARWRPVRRKHRRQRGRADLTVAVGHV